MAWLEFTIETTPQSIDSAVTALSARGFSDLVIEDQSEFETFLEENRAYWDYIDEGLQKKLQGLISEDYPISFLATIAEFDSIYTAPASGFKSSEEYYQQCSAMSYVQNIQIPTHVLTSADDPFVSVQDYRTAPFSKACQLHIEKVGGHLGYYSSVRTPLGTRRWLDYYLFEALQNLTSSL